MRDEHPLPGVDHVVDGVRLNVVHHGTGDGLPILLLHGMPTSSYLWRDVQRDLEHAHRTFAPDLVGLGGSERPGDATRYPLAAQAVMLANLLEDLGLDRVAVVGHDVGGGVAMHLTRLVPDRVAALVLCDAPLHADTWPIPSVAALIMRGLGEVQTTALRLARPVGRAYLRRQLGRGFVAAPLTDRGLRQYTAPLLTREGAPALLKLARGFDASAVEASLDAVAADPPPTLVLWGEQDVFISPAYGRRLADAIPGAAWVPVPDAGHFLPEDRPERVAEELAGFLAELPART